MASSYRSSPHSRTRDLPVLECTRAPRYKACATAHVRQRFLSHDIIRRVLRRPVRLAKHYLSLSSASPRWLTSGVLARTGCVRRRSALQALLAPSCVCVHVSPQRPAGSGGFVTCAGARRQTCMVLLEKRTAPELDGYTLGAFAARSPVWQRPPERSRWVGVLLSATSPTSSRECVSTYANHLRKCYGRAWEPGTIVTGGSLLSIE